MTRRLKEQRFAWGWHRTVRESPDGVATWHLYEVVVRHRFHRFIQRWHENGAVAVCGRRAWRNPTLATWYRPAEAIVCYDCRTIATQAADRIPEETGTRKR